MTFRNDPVEENQRLRAGKPAKRLAKPPVLTPLVAPKSRTLAPLEAWDDRPPVRTAMRTGTKLIMVVMALVIAGAMGLAAYIVLHGPG
ncbi:MAG: hypothetical protein ABI867_30195 [Kofleriaceae bacterium]